MATRDFDPLFHERTRLGILGLLLQWEELDFTTLKKRLGVSDGNLATHLRTLERAGVVEVRKTFVGRRPRTLYRFTPDGKRRFVDYLNSLESFLKALRDPRGEGETQQEEVS